MAVDLSFINYFAPILAFLIVFIVMFALLLKLEIMKDHKWANIFVSFVIASIFVSSAGTRQLTLTIIPWFAVLVICLFLIVVLLSFMGKMSDSTSKGIGIAFLVLIGLVFLVSAFVVFNETLINYLPGEDFGNGDSNPAAINLLDWLYSPRIAGAILLIVIAAIVSYVLVKAK